MDEIQSNLETRTRERLLSAAGEVFAERGFREATVRDICRAAGANIAAVNYHFGDKETLYREVIRMAGCAAIEKYAAPDSPPSCNSPEEGLRRFIRDYLDRLLDDGRPAWHGKLIAREMVEPTPVLDELVEEYVRPQYRCLRAIVESLLGPAATADRTRLCVTSVISQCLFFKNCRPVVERLLPEQAYCSENRASLAAHIAEFSLGAIAAIRTSTEHPPD
jgi:AcrR family transcriptional regulator